MSACFVKKRAHYVRASLSAFVATTLGKSFLDRRYKALIREKQCSHSAARHVLVRRGDSSSGQKPPKHG